MPARRQLAVPGQLLPLQRHPLILPVVIKDEGFALAGIISHHLSPVPLAIPLKPHRHLRHEGWAGGRAGAGAGRGREGM